MQKIKNSNKILNITKIRIQYQKALFFKEYVFCLWKKWLKCSQLDDLTCGFDENKHNTSVIMYKIYDKSKKSAMKPKQCELLKSLLKLYNNDS